VRAKEIQPSKLVIFDIDDTLVHTQTKVHVIKDGKVIKSLNSHDFTHYKLQPGESFDFGDFTNAEEFFINAKPIIPMMNQLKRDIATGNKVVMVTARSDFNDKELFLDTFRKYGIDMSKVHVYRAGNMVGKIPTEEKKKIIIKNLLDKNNYTKTIMYDDAIPNLHAFMSLKKDYPNTKFYAWHVSLDGEASEYSRTDEGIIEAEEDTPNAREITNTLQKAGYKQLGSGADSTVWSKDEGSVIKIIMPEEGENITTAADTFYKFYEFCQKNKNIPNLPKFIDIGGKHHSTFEINGKEYLQIAMERLYPIPNNTVQEALVWALSDFATGNTPWNKVVSTLTNADYFKHYESPDVQQIQQLVQQTLSNKQQNDKYHYLYELMRLVYATGRVNKVGWDLHTENVMMRKNGELVIIDPWFAMNEGS
jgi:FMN phosphatase YigB (HAD superfamily)